jgi:hypothetical protein
MMKLFFDETKIPKWAEWLAVIVAGVLFGLAVGLIMLGYNLADWIR